MYMYNPDVFHAMLVDKQGKNHIRALCKQPQNSKWLHLEFDNLHMLH